MKKGLSTEALFDWAVRVGKSPPDKQKAIWNAFMRKRGWRDESAEGLRRQVREKGLPDAIVTHFDFFDAEEGRPLRFQAEPLSGAPLPARPLLFENLRSPYDMLGGVVHAPRMLDKIRLHQAGKLPEEWEKFRGGPEAFDGLTCEFLGVPYGEIERRTLEGASDEEILRFIRECGTVRTEEERKIVNTYLAKRGWRDQYAERLQFRLHESGLPADTVATMFDFIDLDEGRLLDPNKAHVL